MTRASGTLQGTRIGGFVGRYRVGERIGAGAMGAVYEAERPDGGLVAVKVMHPQCRAHPHLVQRFRNEGTAGLPAAHPHVVSVLEHGETDDGLPFLVMPMIRGDTLSTRLFHDGALPLRRAATLVQQLLTGLEALHAAGVVHGDVKADNIVMASGDDGSDTAVLIDLGLASRWVANGDSQLPEGTMVSGTPEYMAPELICGHRPTPATDVYAAGIVLYELITGTTPFAAATTPEILRRHLGDDVTPPSLQAVDIAIPPILDRIVMQALDKQPGRRFASAAEFAATLERARPYLDSHERRGADRFTSWSRGASTQDWHGAADAPPVARTRVLGRHAPDAVAMRHDQHDTALARPAS